jgi:hypothetical protein
VHRDNLVKPGQAYNRDTRTSYEMQATTREVEAQILSSQGCTLDRQRVPDDHRVPERRAPSSARRCSCFFRSADPTPAAMFEPRTRSDRPYTRRQKAGVTHNRGNVASQLGHGGGWVERGGIARPLSWGFVGLSIFIIVTYGLRGAAYPLFAFGFLVWIQTPREEIRGSAGGWFLLAFTGGLPTFGSAAAAGSLGLIGYFNALLLSCLGSARTPCSSYP